VQGEKEVVPLAEIHWFRSPEKKRYVEKRVNKFKKEKGQRRGEEEMYIVMGAGAGKGDSGQGTSITKKKGKGYKRRD